MSEDSRLVTINGQLFNGQIVDGVEWEITDLTGMGEPANVFASDQNVAADGAWATTGYRAPRVVGVQGVIRATDPLRVEYASDILRGLFTLSEFPLTLHYITGDRTVWCRRDGQVEFGSRELPTEIFWSAVLKCIDPAIYAGDWAGSNDIRLSTGLPQTAGGIAFPVAFPVTFTGSSATGDVDGYVPAGGRATFRIWGPVSDPQILVEDHDRTRYRLAWLGTIPADVWLDVDPQQRTALLNGQASRVPYIRQWPKLGAGRNIFRFRASSYDTGRLDITIRPTL